MTRDRSRIIFLVEDLGTVAIPGTGTGTVSHSM
jgi:hypothetical protein